MLNTPTMYGGQLLPFGKAIKSLQIPIVDKNNLYDIWSVLEIYADINNPFVITPYDGLDPETDNASTIYPNTRGFNIGLEVAF